MYGQIYEIECLVNHKRYIGRTINTLNERLRNHWNYRLQDRCYDYPMYIDMRQYGKENFTIKHICWCDNKEQLAETEAIYTELWMCFYGKENIYNDNIGDSRSNKTKDKISDSTKSKPKTYCRKPVLQYDLEGNFIREWESMTQASKELKISQPNISACCKGIYKYTHGYIFEYKNE